MPRFPSRLRSDERGLALLEVLVSTVILTGGLMAALKPLTGSQRGSATAQQIEQVVAVASSALDDMRSARYADLATIPGTGAPAMSANDPRKRLTGSGTQYQVPGGKAEDLVAPTAKTAFKDYEEATVGQATMRIYRFVSWRDEECPIADLSQLEGTLTSVKSLLGTTTGLLTSLTGPSGTLTGALSDGNGLLSGGLLGNLLLRPLLSPVTTLVTGNLTPLNALLTSPALLAPANSLLSAINAILGPDGHLTGAIDLCDVPDGIVPDVTQLSAIKAALPALDTELTTLSPLVTTAANTISQINHLNLVGLLGSVVTGLVNTVNGLNTSLANERTAIANVLGGVKDTLGNPAQLSTLMTSTAAGLTTLAGWLANPNTTHNTKRVTVAVWLKDPKAGYGPNRPIWMSTVVTDPSAGLL